MARLYLSLVLHNHQPVGNYGFVIEQLFRQAYEPMLASLERHPGVRVAVHNSGPLVDWIDANHRDYLDRLRALCDRGQVEIVTGGYYEPILPMIPDDDKVGQIAKMTRFIEERFAQHPTGMWLAERVWEPGLPLPLARAGVEWTLADDAHFRMVGLTEDQLDGYYLTEDQGARVKIFPGSQRLRYTIPWLAVEDVIAELRALAATKADRVAPLIVLGDDGEKFGGWPTTYKHVWDDGWMERFLAALERERDWLETITPGEYARQTEARGLVYLPTASYAEMMEWAMPAASGAAYHRLAVELQQQGREDLLEFMRGGFWRYFLAKYPEVNAMHKRGLRVHRKLERAPHDGARDALWQAQCNCPYWHGVFGGIYLRNIRAATNANLVRAERLADEASNMSGVTIHEEDLDYDGQPEILVQTPSLSVMLHPRNGGMISELDLRRRDHALLDVVMRHREAYHEPLLEGGASQASDDLTNIHGGVRLKEEGLAAELVFDRYRRGALQEWILPPEATVDRFARGQARPAFAPDGSWSSDVTRDDRGVSIALERTAGGWRIDKRIDVPSDAESLSVTYVCTNVSRERRGARFVSEWNLSAPHRPDGDDRVAQLALDGRTVDVTLAPGFVDAVTETAFGGSACYAIAFSIVESADVWHFPVYSVSSSEGGLERAFQGTSVSLTKPIELAPGESMSLRIRLAVVDLT